jgi:hypothetical protein
MECFIALCHCRCCCCRRRYYLEIVGRRRIKITSTRDLDGYRVASAELLKDAAPAAAAAAGSSSGAAPADAPAGDAAATDATDSVSNTVSNNSDSDSLPELVESVVGAADGLLERVRGVLASRRVGPGQIRELFDRWVFLSSLSNDHSVWSVTYLVFGVFDERALGAGQIQVWLGELLHHSAFCTTTDSQTP